MNKHNIHGNSTLKHLLTNETDKVVYLDEDQIISRSKTNPQVLGVILYDYYLNNPENNYNTGRKAIFYFLAWNNIFKNKYNNENYLE